jgi:hypothetical protein
MTILHPWVPYIDNNLNLVIRQNWTLLFVNSSLLLQSNLISETHYWGVGKWLGCRDVTPASDSRDEADISTRHSGPLTKLLRETCNRQGMNSKHGCHDVPKSTKLYICVVLKSRQSPWIFNCSSPLALSNNTSNYGDNSYACMYVSHQRKLQANTRDNWLGKIWCHKDDAFDHLQS